MPVMKDFLGHELQFGDIVIWGSGSGMYFTRVVGFVERTDYHHDWVVRTFGLGGDPTWAGNYKEWEPQHLIWFSSDYAHVLDRYVIDLLHPELGNRS